ncbi:hypothetical protein [Deinococcus altitudinis]|uniref:hypothetical protein n=1 Tax=Deinococcus altitudinis TaxID=468914 RepID=UPI0038927235
MALTSWGARFGAALAVLVVFSLGQAQTAQVPCTLAEKLSLYSFSLQGNYDDSEAGQDAAAYDYSQCLAAGLTRDLSRMPQLSARLVMLRRLYRQLNAADGQLASVMEGGGTMYAHGIPRIYPEVETTLRTLSALEGSKYGAALGPQFTASLRSSRQALSARLSLLDGWKPSGDFPFDPAVYRSALKTYKDTAAAIMKLLGDTNNAATAAGYLPLGGSVFLDDILNSND